MVIAVAVVFPRIPTPPEGRVRLSDDTASRYYPLPVIIVLTAAHARTLRSTFSETGLRCGRSGGDETTRVRTSPYGEAGSGWSILFGETRLLPTVLSLHVDHGAGEIFSKGDSTLHPAPGFGIPDSRKK